MGCCVEKETIGVGNVARVFRDADLLQKREVVNSCVAFLTELEQKQGFESIIPIVCEIERLDASSTLVLKLRSLTTSLAWTVLDTQRAEAEEKRRQRRKEAEAAFRREEEERRQRREAARRREEAMTDEMKEARGKRRHAEVLKRQAEYDERERKKEEAAIEEFFERRKGKRKGFFQPSPGRPWNQRVLR